MKRSILKCRDQERHRSSPAGIQTTPPSPNITSPAELLSGQIFKSTLSGKIYPSKDQEDWLKARQDNQSHYYNQARAKSSMYKILRARHGVPLRSYIQGNKPCSSTVETNTGYYGPHKHATLLVPWD